MKTTTRLLVVAAVVLLAMTLSTAAHAQTPLPLNQARSSTIVGNRAGAFDRYTFEHPGGGQSITLRMAYSPRHDNAGYGIGFLLYGDNGKLIGRGTPVEGDPTVLTLAVTANTPTQYLILVQDYYPGFQMSYTIEAEGVTPAQPGQKPPANLGTATNPSLLVQVAQGSIPGNRAGSFYYYTYRGQAGESIWIKMTYQPKMSVIAPGVGFNVYNGPNLVGQGKALTDDESIRWVNLVPSQPTTFLIQVYNYIPPVQLQYELELTTTPPPTQ